MGRQILVYCDAHNAEDGKKIEAQIVDVAIRISDPNDPGSVRSLVGSLEICLDHQTPLSHVASMLENYGVRLKDDAEQLLVNTVRMGAKRAGESEYVLCYDCTPPKKLKRNSLYSHSEKIHGEKMQETDYRPFVPPADGEDHI
jgi:hypothetical protein